MEGDSWEELDTAEIVNGAESLRWLVWVNDTFPRQKTSIEINFIWAQGIKFPLFLQPKIDEDTLESFATECPRIIVNPRHTPLGFRGSKVPREALPDSTLDNPIVKDIDPATWATRGSIQKATPHQLSSPTELSIAERFRLAFVERDARLAPKRAKNARQHQRRAEREYMMSDARAKAVALALQASKSLHGRS